MKLKFKLILTVILIINLTILFSCRSNIEYEYIITYKVYYTSSYSKLYTVSNNKPFYIGSDRGSNYIKTGSITGATIINTSAPIEIIELKKIKIIK